MNNKIINFYFFKALFFFVSTYIILYFFLPDRINVEYLIASIIITSVYSIFLMIPNILNSKKTDKNIKMEENRFQKLTPIDDVDITGYEKAFDFIFENSDIKNIAITGAYSAGKSSVLASYKKKHSPKQDNASSYYEEENEIIKFIHISLAQYRSFDEDRGNASESILEGKILNQLIHQIPPNDIPQTNFRIKEKIGKRTVIKITAWITIFVSSLTYLTLFKSWSQYVYSFSEESIIRNILDITIKKSSSLIIILFILFSISFFISTIVRMQKNKNIFRKFNLHGNEIELFEESEDSYFDKYLNEVLYIFDNVDADVIVFEDLDRFNINTIFERLKEVNILVNLQRERKNEIEKPLRFFYLLRDDIFISKDRTKFFDFIIPIIPVLDTSNSYDQLLYHLKTGEYIDKFDKKFLQEISLYIDDMRILKNIYNEFIIYIDNIESIKSIELSYNKMFSMITYKNIFPKDFSELQLNRGFVSSIFATQEKIKVKKIDELEKKLIIEEHEFSYEELPDDAREQYEDNIKSMKKEIIKTKNLSLAEMINRDNIDQVFRVTDTKSGKSYNEIKDSGYFDLLKYLIRNGYIDETYSDYMSYFYEGSLSIKDKIFLRSITDKKSKLDNYKLDNVRQVINHLNTGSFAQEEILNHDILSFLLANDSSYREFLETFILQLKDTKNFKFLQSYFFVKTETSKLVLFLNKLWPQMLYMSIRDSKLTEEEIFFYSINTFYYSDKSTIRKMNMDNYLTKFVSNNPEYANINAPNIDNLMGKFSILNVKFESIDYKKSDKELLKAIYINNFYEINFKNLLLFITEFFQISCEEDLRHRNYTIINQLTDHNLLNYVNENIDVYMDVILSNCDDRILEQESNALMLLNNKNVSNQNKNKYIDFLETKITSIEDISEQSVLENLLDKNLIVYSEKNILNYYKQYKLNSALINFINSEQTPLDFSEVIMQYDDKFIKDISDNILLCNTLYNVKYEEILVTLNYLYTDIVDVSALDSDKFEILVKNRILPMTSTGLGFIRNHFPDSVSYYIRNNIEKYTEIMTQQTFDFNELLEILSSEESDEIKIELLKFTTKPISILEMGYTKKINEYILINNLDTGDLLGLFASHDDWDSNVQKVIEKLAISYINHIISNSKSISISQSLVTYIFNFQDLDRNLKLNLLLTLVSTISKSELTEYLDILDLTNYSNIFKLNARVDLDINAFNKNMLDIFKERKWIKKFVKKKNGKLEYQVYKIKQ